MRQPIAILVAAAAAALVPGASLGALSPPDRAAIDATLDVFVPAAVARRHPERAWNLATAAMHVGGTRAGWARGDLPVAPFPAAGSTFHGWSVDTLRPGVADLVLLLHPRPGVKVGSISYDVGMRKVVGRWLVDSFVPAASFAPAGSISGITAAPDLAAGAAQTPYARSGRIPGIWLIAFPAVIGGLIVLVPLTLFVLHRVRSRRAARHYASTTRVV